MMVDGGGQSTPPGMHTRQKAGRPAAADALYNPGRYFVPGSKTMILCREEMKLKLLACAAALILPAFLFTQTAGAAKSDSCAHCHGTDGNSTSSAFPSLAGQTREYLYRQIKAFKEGSRKNAMMSTAVVVLSDQDMQDLAEYFSGQTLVRSTAKTDPAIIEQGKKIASEAQCVACHQPSFKGLNEFPRISRQRYTCTSSSSSRIFARAPASATRWVPQPRT
jgi:cytochrome c553